jgi:tetraacyldisaccharide 4'-kinase
MSIGGTGKTQVVIWLAGLLKKQGIDFVIISKGYGSNLKSAVLVNSSDNPLSVGDEAILLSEYGKVIASPKVTSAVALLESLKSDVIIVDDGMQNPSFLKDFTILTIDPLKGNGNGLIFPAGPLREDPGLAISRADLILMIGNKECQDTNLLSEISASGKPFYYGQIKPVSMFDTNKEYIAFTGIGNPDKFFSLLREYKIKVAAEISYPDHYSYPLSEAQKLIEKAGKDGYGLITTKKDYVKIPANYDIKFLDIELEFKNEREIIMLLNEKILKKN